MTPEKARKTLEAFVVRMRRIQAHSLLATDEWEEWGGGRFHVTPREDQQIEIRWVLPDEEAFESLVARCRPVLVNSERVHWSRVLDALEVLLGDRAAEREAVSRIRKHFEDQTDRKSAQGFHVRSVKEGEEVVTSHDTSLAYGWLYGDLVHADSNDALAGGQEWINGRFMSAVPVFVRIVESLLALLGFVKERQTEGCFELSATAWEMPVIAENPIVKVGRGVMAPVGTPIEELDAFADEAFGALRPEVAKAD